MLLVALVASVPSPIILLVVEPGGCPFARTTPSNFCPKACTSETPDSDTVAGVEEEFDIGRKFPAEHWLFGGVGVGAGRMLTGPTVAAPGRGARFCLGTWIGTYVHCSGFSDLEQ